jgi:hypothetical protein
MPQKVFSKQTHWECRSVLWMKMTTGHYAIRFHKRGQSPAPRG